MEITIIACSKHKRTQISQAKDLYTGQLFRLSRMFAEEHSQESWVILSALYGMVLPTEVLPPYEVTLKYVSKKAKEQWASDVALNLGPWLEKRKPSCIWMLAGRDYREYLLPRLYAYVPSALFKIPLMGLGIGSQKAWLQSSLKPNGKALSEVLDY